MSGDSSVQDESIDSIDAIADTIRDRLKEYKISDDEVRILASLRHELSSVLNARQEPSVRVVLVMSMMLSEILFSIVDMDNDDAVAEGREDAEYHPKYKENFAEAVRCALHGFASETSQTVTVNGAIRFIMDACASIILEGEPDEDEIEDVEEPN